MIKFKNNKKEISESNYLIFDHPIIKSWKYYVKKIVSKILSVYYIIDMEFNKPLNIDKKYKVSICAIFKNEARYLKEWIEYHLLVGVEHFYLYNNFSTDNYKIILQEYVEKNIVTLINWPVNLGQYPAYKNCIKNFRDETKWLGFIDLDEFVVPNSKLSIYDILYPYEKNRAAVLIYWRYFGTSGLMDRSENSLVLEDFTVCWSKYANIGKCFFNTNYEFNEKCKHNKCMHHVFWGNYNGKDYPPVNVFGKFILYDFHPVKSSDMPIQINHYLLKSYKEYWDRKSKKGGGTHDIGMHDKEYFYKHEQKCSSIDYNVYRYLSQLKEKMGIIE